MSLAPVRGRSSKKDEAVQPVGTSKTVQPIGMSSKMKGCIQVETPRTAKSDDGESLLKKEENKKNFQPARRKTEIQTAGRQTITQYFENERRKTKEKARKLKKTGYSNIWKRMNLG